MKNKEGKNSKRGHWDLTLSKLVMDHEFDKFRVAIPDGQDARSRRENLMLWMLINTGIRASELCSLRVKDMPGVLGSLHIEVYQGKGKKSRNVPVSSQFAHDIAEYVRDVRPQTVPQRYAKHGLNGWLFFDRRKKKYTRQQVYRMVVRVAKKAGIIKTITPHMWRHRFATRALDKNGQNLFVVKTLLGHSSIATTEKYLHLVGMLNRECGDMLDQKYQGLTA